MFIYENIKSKIYQITNENFAIRLEDYPRGVVFRVGLFTGMCFVSVAAVILSICYYQTMADVLNLPSVKEGNMITAIRLYRPGFSIWLFLVFIGVNIWGWRTAGVNHVLIFEIDPREHLRKRVEITVRNPGS